MTLQDMLLKQNGQPLTGRTQAPRTAYYVAHSILEHELFPISMLPVNGRDIFLRRAGNGMSITFRGGDELKPLHVVLRESDGKVVIDCYAQGSALKVSAELSENFTTEALADFTRDFRQMLFDMLNVYTKDESCLAPEPGMPTSNLSPYRQIQYAQLPRQDS